MTLGQKLEIDWDNKVAVVATFDGSMTSSHPFANLRHYLEEMKNEPGFEIQKSRERIFDLISGEVDLTATDIREILVAKRLLAF